MSMEPFSKLVHDFENDVLDAATFDHRAHIQLAWHYLAHLPAPETMIRMRDGLRRLTQRVGAPDKYHETITFAYILLIARQRRAGEAWEAFEQRNPALFQTGLAALAPYYRGEDLQTLTARQTFVLPQPA